MVAQFGVSDWGFSHRFAGRGPARSPDRRDNREIEFWHVGPDSQKAGALRRLLAKDLSAMV